MISIQQHSELRGLDLPLLQKRAERLLQCVGYADSDLTMVFCDDAEICELNAEYRQKDRPTDVLSFPQIEGEDLALPEGMPVPLGDIVISLETAERQAQLGCLERLFAGDQAPRWGLDEEVCFLMLHGVLHLTGLDHMTPEDAEVMEAAEARWIPVLLNWPREMAKEQ